MSDSQSRAFAAPAQTAPAARIARVRSVAGWMPWVGLILAIIWWGALALSLVTVFDINAIAQQPPVTLAGGALIAILPGLLILMGSFMGRESARAAAANSLVLEAAAQLLDPSEAGVRKAAVLASRMAASAQDIENAIGEAVSSMKAMSSELGDERLRLESVSYAAADNARDLSRQLATERAALEALIRELRAQGDTLNEAIPRQAELMVKAARAASEEIGRVDGALDERLEALRESSAALASEMSRLGTFAGDANRQGQAVAAAIAEAEARLERTRQTVDAAIRASDAALAAASGTSATLQANVGATLDALRRAVAAPAVASAPAGQAAPARPVQPVMTPAPPAAPTPPVMRPAAPPAAPAMNGSGARPSNGPLFAAPPHRVTPRAPDPVAPAPMDDELFEVAPPRPVEARQPPAPALLRGHLPQETVQPTVARPVPPPFDPIEETAPEPQPNAMNRGVDGPTGDADPRWSSILSDMDRGQSERPAAARSREETAENVIRRLEAAGVHLANVFRPKDKKKIAAAARKGEHQRRLAIQSAARNEIERVASRVRRDDALAELARDFVNMEAPDAIAALERTQASNRNASPRLSAFLLLDAAMGG